jgi:predicted acyltransferase
LPALASSIVGVFTEGIAARIGSFGLLFEASAVLLAEWLILYWMYRRRIFLAA